MSEIIAGIDIGNATTEIAVAEIHEDGHAEFIASGIGETTGTKGTPENVEGILSLLNRMGFGMMNRPDRILLNNATPVIADFAMDTITETVITDSAMIGHNPDTPGGVGLGVGETIDISELSSYVNTPEDTELPDIPYVAVIPASCSFKEAAVLINAFSKAGGTITAAIVQRDEGTLINNRLDRIIPIVDEVSSIEAVPLHMKCAVEVAEKGRSIHMLSNPYGLATIFNLTPEETDYCIYIAKALIGNKSAVVIRTPHSDIQKRVIPAGTIEILGETLSLSVDASEGASAIMQALSAAGTITDVRGSSGSNAGGLFERIRTRMSESCGIPKEEIKISDIFAADSNAERLVSGGLAQERAMESGVAVAAMVKTDRSFMDKVASSLQQKMDVPVEVGGVEGEMAFGGVLTTPGVSLPVLMIDVGAGSTDGAYMTSDRIIYSIHLAGAGNLVTSMIQSEGGIDSFENAEVIKKYPLAKVESLYRIRYENGDTVFFDQPLPVQYFGHTVAVVSDQDMYIVESSLSMEKLRHIRRRAKEKVIAANIIRCIDFIERQVGPCRRVVLVGGTVLDFELSDILTDRLMEMKITAGEGNIRGSQGPRNAVATGLILDYCKRKGMHQ